MDTFRETNKERVFRQYKRSAYQDWECQGVLFEEHDENNKHLLNQISSLVAKDQHSEEQPFRLRWAEPLADFAIAMTKIQSAQFKKAVRLNPTNEFGGQKKMQITFIQM